MAATTIKVLHEWNQSGQNYGFLFKQIGERHSILRDEDFAVGFMNQVMESKLKQFTNIICMDGTHNTNIRGWELTTVLVKDDRGVGFPVAFLVSSRKDQREINNTIEKLLDMLDRVVEDKEWNRIIETERPSTETYQSRIVRDRHRKAENLQNMVEEVGFGEFSVRSNSNKIYKVVYGDRVCRNDCRLMYCVVCQICLHHYKCQCPEFMVKNNLCKHMHMVALFERERYECGLGQTKDTFTDIEEHNYCKRVLMETENEHNYCDMQKNEEVKMLIENNQQTPLPLDDETFRKLKQESLNNTLNALNIDDFKELMSNIDGWLRKKNEKNLTKKRVQETQQYYPEVREVKNDEFTASGSEATLMVEGIKKYCSGVNTVGKAWYEDVKLCGSVVKMKLDTGAEVNTIPEKLVRQLKCMNKIVRDTKMLLESWGGYKIKPLGFIDLDCTVKGLSPAELVFNRNIKTKLPVPQRTLEFNTVDPNNVIKKLHTKQQQTKYYYDRTTKAKPNFVNNQNVTLQKGGKWESAKIVNKCNEPRSYIVKDRKGQLLRRNSIHLRDSLNEYVPIINCDDNDDDKFIDVSKQSVSQRQRRTPSRFKDYILY
ncbi:hypothetical protein Zmor_025046 [Zophobas morio]|uniref:SWIM-type domain-containing protein n=1 Tax=Zophobas morio TaxID=2755281 RepID=A0AA38HRB7_9CUCU|nr:hypothetical protein Zmor_025046 [Zophobas morio]